MATVSKGRTFVSGETVTPAKLNELVDNATVTAIQTADISDAQITTAKIADASSTTTGVTNSKMRHSAALSVIGNSTNSAAAPSDIAAATDAHVLRRSGTSVGFGTVATAGIADAAITAPKLSGAQTGSAPIYGCRAWVNFDGTKDTTGAASTANTDRQIRASGNVTSVTRNQAGDYFVNFTTAMPNANYAVVVTARSGNDATASALAFSSSLTAQSTSSVRIRVINPTVAYIDSDNVSVAIFA